MLQKPSGSHMAASGLPSLQEFRQNEKNDADGKIDNGEWKQICNSLSQNLGADYDEKLIADIKENFQLLAKGQSTISTSEYETNEHQTSAYTHIHTRAQTCIHIISRAQGHCFVESKLLHS